MEKENEETIRWLTTLESLGKEEKRAKLVKHLHELASLPKRKRIFVNLTKLDKYSKEGDNIIVPGKVLGNGKISKKINIAAINYSKEAETKLKSSNCTVVGLEDLLKKGNFRVLI